MYTRKFAKISSLKREVRNRSKRFTGHRNRFAGRLGVSNRGSAIFTESKVNSSMQRFWCSRLPSVRSHVTVSQCTGPIVLYF
jgi:hypothetical protein